MRLLCGSFVLLLYCQNPFVVVPSLYPAGLGLDLPGGIAQKLEPGLAHGILVFLLAVALKRSALDLVALLARGSETRAIPRLPRQLAQTQIAQLVGAFIALCFQSLAVNPQLASACLAREASSP